MDKSRTKVLFLTLSLKMRGAERMLVNIVNGLDRRQFLNQVISLSNDNPLAKQISPEAANFIMLPRKWRYDMRPALQIRKIILENQINTILAFDIFCYFYIWCALWRIKPKPKVFVSIHHTKFNNLKHFLRNLAIARFLTGEECFLSVCNAQADYWAKKYFIPRELFFTIYNGVDINFFCPSNDLIQRKENRSNLNIPNNAFVILQVASLTKDKDHETSLSALKYLVDKDASLPFILALVGKGTDKRENQLRGMAYQLGISDRVLFSGIQNDVRPFYEIADIFTLTSKSETFSVAALEAMAMGLPCVLTDIGGTREMIVEGLNGYIVQPKSPRKVADGWLAAFENKSHVEPENIRQRVIDHFSLIDCVRAYEEILRL